MLMRLSIVLLLAVCCGCSLRSRYAMDDPVYAAKYAEGVERWDLLGKAKQALDARHTAGLSGVYAAGGAQLLPASGNAVFGGELGGEAYATNWLTGRAALSGYAGEDGYFTGLDLGARAQTPTRIAAFAGVGAFNGYASHEVDAESDLRDNDGNGFIDEWGEKETEYDGWLSIFYPEVGAHFWINGSWRVTGYGRYLITSEGRAHDDWLVGLQLAAFAR
jgi:hypothetical protein